MWHAIRSAAGQHPLIAFGLLAYLLAWPVWLLAGDSRLALLLVWLGGFAPAVSAMVVTALVEGRTGLTGLLRRIFQWRVRGWYYLAALGIPLAGTALLTGLYALVNGELAALQMLAGWFGSLWRNAAALILTLLLGLIIVMGEEIGWRGFLLPRLRSRHSDIYASLLVGLAWGLWHLPDLWPFQARYTPRDLLIFMLDIVLISVVYTWLLANSQGSLLPVGLFHATYNLIVMFARPDCHFCARHACMRWRSGCCAR